MSHHSVKFSAWVLTISASILSLPFFSLLLFPLSFSLIRTESKAR